MTKRITIVGGGASGTLLAINLLKHAPAAPVEINLVERQSSVGRGVAFGTTRDTHLLNVPAGRMGAFPDDVEHFHKWLVEHGHTFAANDFVPRRLFGEYLREIFSNAAAAARADVRLNVVDDEAVDMCVNGDSAEVMLRSGEILPSHKVVLAFGNFTPPTPAVPDVSFGSADKYFPDPWSPRLYETLTSEDDIFIIGTGLSMIDVVMHLKEQGHKGKISAISTRGLLPAVHRLGFTYPSFYDEIRSMHRVTDILKAVRRHIRAAESDSSDWRAVIDSLRPVTQELWLALPLAEKRYFMQHLSRYWNVARHRMPESAANALEQMQADGKLAVLKGRLKHISQNGRFKVAFAASGVEHVIESDVLVNCIGSEANFSRIDSTFVKNLINRGHIRNDELSLGIAASPDGRVIDKTGESSSVVFTLGTALKGTLWESTAIPEIRTQAARLAVNLLAD